MLCELCVMFTVDKTYTLRTIGRVMIRPCYDLGATTLAFHMRPKQNKHTSSNLVTTVEHYLAEHNNNTKHKTLIRASLTILLNLPAPPSFVP